METNKKIIEEFINEFTCGCYNDECNYYHESEESKEMEILLEKVIATVEKRTEDRIILRFQGMAANYETMDTISAVRAFKKEKAIKTKDNEEI